MTYQERKKARKRKQQIRSWMLVCWIGVLLFLLAFLFLIYPSNHFNRGTWILGMDMSRASISGAKEVLDETLGDLSVTVMGQDGAKVELTGEEIGWGYSKKDLKQIVKNTHETEGFFASLSGEAVESFWDISPSIDQSALTKILKKSIFTTADPVEPQNATIVRGEDNGFVIHQPVPGNILVDDGWIEYVADQIGSHISNNDFDMEIVIPTDYYKQADRSATDPDLLQTLAVMNETAYKAIMVDIGADTTVDMYLKDVTSIDFDGSYRIDEEKVRAYAKYLTEEYTTLFKDRIITLPNGRTITVKSTKFDTYGWQLNEEQTYEKLLTALEKGKKRAFAAFISIGVARSDGPDLDIGDNYIFVDIDKQKVYAILDGELFYETDCVTGTETDPARRTPSGIYAIWQHDESAYLEGEDYLSYVSYWMALDYRGTGLHDASWRTEFGGDIYKTDGSHRCVNLPGEAAYTLFEHYGEGTPVILYRASDNGVEAAEENASQAESSNAMDSSEETDSSANETDSSADESGSADGE